MYSVTSAMHSWSLWYRACSRPFWWLLSVAVVDAGELSSSIALRTELGRDVTAGRLQAETCTQASAPARGISSTYWQT